MGLCKVKSFVYYEHHKGDFIMEHSHNCYEFVFYMEGKGVITADNDVLLYDGPTATLVSPFVKHDEKTVGFSRLFIILFETVNLNLLKKFTYFKPDAKQTEFLIDLFNRMQEEEQEKKLYYQRIVNLYFNIIINNFLRQVSQENKKSYEKELVGRIKNYIKENYNQTIDFAQIAASFGYSYDRFRHIFQKETKTSLYQYLMECKLYAAKQMLLTTDMQTKDIALRCGFSSSIHFNAFFKKKMNISPMQFRHSSHNQIDVGVFNIEGGK